MTKKGILFVVSGPSGSGKTTLCRQVEQHLRIPHSVSYTTRAPRKGEIEGKDYHFLSLEKFEEMEKRGEFLESAWVHGNRYGTALQYTQDIINKGNDLILDLDTQGALAVKSKIKDAVLIFIDAPDDESLANRLGQRGTEDPEIKAKRLAQASHERSFKEEYHYHVTNDSLEKTLQFIIHVIENERKIKKST